MKSEQLSNESLVWCRKVARKIKRAYFRYMHAKQRLRNSRSVILVGSGNGNTRNRTDEALAYVATWEEFIGGLSDEERELVEDITEGERVGTYFLRRERRLLVSINRRGRDMGLW